MENFRNKTAGSRSWGASGDTLCGPGGTPLSLGGARAGPVSLEMDSGGMERNHTRGPTGVTARLPGEATQLFTETCPRCAERNFSSFTQNLGTQRNSNSGLPKPTILVHRLHPVCTHQNVGKFTGAIQMTENQKTWRDQGTEKYAGKRTTMETSVEPRKNVLFRTARIDGGKSQRANLLNCRNSELHLPTQKTTLKWMLLLCALLLMSSSGEAQIISGQ